MSAPSRTIAILFVMLAPVGVRVPGAGAAPGQSLSLTAGLSTYYNDNILEYSDGQIRDFELGLHPERYAIQTRDDLVLNPSLALAWELAHQRRRQRTLRLKTEGDFHGKNGTADFRSLSAGWRESWSRDRRFALSYYLLPRFYLRQLFDDDAIPAYAGLTKYRRADFSLQIASASWTQRLRRNLLIELGYQYERRDYNHDFDERDSGLHLGELGVSVVRLPRRATVSVVGGYRESHARGLDGDEPEPVPDPDISYHGLVAGLGGRLELARSGAWRLLGDLGYVLETRDYDSNRPTDRYHLGRTDILHAIEVGLRTAYRPHWSARAFYRFENNTATLGAIAPLSADAGSYHANQAGIAIEWSGDLWTAVPETPEGESEPQQ